MLFSDLFKCYYPISMEVIERSSFHENTQICSIQHQMKVNLWTKNSYRLANELTKNLKTPEDLSQFDRLLKKLSVEAALNAEMTHHLGYEKISPD